MAKYFIPVHASESINTKKHPFVGVIWPVKGSKGDMYSIEMVDKGFTCDCPARVKCKHIKEIEAKF